MEALNVNFSKIQRLKSFLKAHSDLIALLVSIVYIVIFGLVLLDRSFDIGIRYHEIDSYALPTISIQYRGSFTMKPSDLVLAQRDFPELYTGINSFDDLRSAKLLQATNDNDIWLAYYFPIYSLICIPVKVIYQLFGAPQYESFIVTNVLLVIVSFVVVLFCSKMPKWYRFAYICLLSMSPLEHYCTYIGAEIMMFSFVAMAIIFYYDKAYCRAGILVSLASMANPTILLFGLLMIANYIVVEVVLYYKQRKDLTARQICWQGFWKLARLGVCYLIVFIPFIMNFLYLGVVNGTISLADFKTLPHRFLMYLFDLNLGFFSFTPLLVIAVIIAIPFVIVRKKFNLFWLYSAFIVTVFAYSIMFHINCGMYYCSRYVIWSYPLLAMILVAFFIGTKYRARVSISVFALCIAVSSLFLGINSNGLVFPNTTNNVTSIVMKYAPSLYNPLHSTFALRTGCDEFNSYYNKPPISVYKDNEYGLIRKMLIKGDEETKRQAIENYRILSGDAEKYKQDIYSIPNDGKWHYFNIGPFCGYELSDYGYEFKATELLYNGDSGLEEGRIRLGSGGAQYGPFAVLPGSEYMVAIYGENLSGVTYDFVYLGGSGSSECKELYRSDEVVIYTTRLEFGANHVNTRTYNNTNVTVYIEKIRIMKYSSSEIEWAKNELLSENSD